MQFRITTLTTLTATFAATAMALDRPSTFLTTRSTCGLINGLCNQNNCQGLNDPNGGLGVCANTAVSFYGCPCDSVCTTANGACNGNGCDGFPSSSARGGGRCSAGSYAGCFCNI